MKDIFLKLDLCFYFGHSESGKSFRLQVEKMKMNLLPWEETYIVILPDFQISLPGCKSKYAWDHLNTRYILQNEMSFDFKDVVAGLSNPKIISENDLEAKFYAFTDALKKVYKR